MYAGMYVFMYVFIAVAKFTWESKSEEWGRRCLCSELGPSETGNSRIKEGPGGRRAAVLRESHHN